jgi:hypothetical protein
MGISGVVWNPKKEEVLESLKKHGGVITHAAKALKVDRRTLRAYVKRSDELSAELEDLRFHYNEELLDGAEETLRHAVYQREDLAHSLKAAMFILNNKGRQRGWSLVQGVDDFKGIMQDKIMGEIKVLYKELKDKE